MPFRNLEQKDDNIASNEGGNSGWLQIWVDGHIASYHGLISG